MVALCHHRARDSSENPAEGIVPGPCGGVVTDSPVPLAGALILPVLLIR